MAKTRESIIAEQIDDDNNALHSYAEQKTGSGNEAYDAGVVRGVVIKNFPCCPAPKVDVQVTEVFGVSTRTPLAGRLPIC